MKSDIKSASEILVRRVSKVLIEPVAGAVEPASDMLVAAFAENLQSVGYVPSKELVSTCSTLSIADLSALNDDVMNSLRKMRGAHRSLSPMYPNFPKQVVNMSKAGLYINAFLHYLTNGKFLPSTPKELREKLHQNVELKILNLATEKELEAILVRLATANTSLAQHDKEDLVWLINRYCGNFNRLVPDKVQNRETRAIVNCVLLRCEHHDHRADVVCDTVTDVLRLAAAISDGDVSLADPVKFVSFNRTQRRNLLELLAAQNNLIEDMLRWKTRWIRLGERLHPGEFKKKYPIVVEAFGVLRNNLPFLTFNSELETSLQQDDVPAAVALLRTRPGMFARKLDHVLRLAEASESASVLSNFAAISDKVSTPVLLQVQQHFAARTSPPALRVFLPKGVVQKAQAIKYNLDPLDDDVCRSVVESCSQTLKSRFSSLPPLGKSFVDPELKNFMLPFSQRSASRALRTPARGSRLRLPDGDTLRFFIWWKNGRDRTDLDLSAALFDREFLFIDDIAFYNIKNFGGHHSGDIVDAPAGASEFIDVSLSRCKDFRTRYIVMCVNSYTDQPYCDLPECFAGWMAREKPNSGEVFEAKTVQDKFDLTANSKIAIPAIFDIEQREVIWTDLSMSNTPKWFNTLAANLYGVQFTLRSLVDMRKPDLHNLLTLHVEARGELVGDRELAETVFSVDQGIQFDLARIASEFM